MSILVITGSARQESFTRQVGAAFVAATADAVLAPRLTDLPYFDQDLEATPPATVTALRAQVEAADYLVIVTPEYNGAISGLLANTIDWLSRPVGDQPGVLAGKPVLAVAASPGGFGGARALVALRTVLGNAGAVLMEATLTIPEVHLRLAGEGLDLHVEVAGLLAAETARVALVA